MTFDRATLAGVLHGIDPSTAEAIANGRARVTERSLPFDAIAVQVVINEPWGERGAWFGVRAGSATQLSGDPDAFTDLAQASAAEIADVDTAVAYVIALLDTTRSFDQPEYRVESASDIRMRPPLDDIERGERDEFLARHAREIAPAVAKPGVGGGFDVTLFRVRRGHVERVTVTISSHGAATMAAERLEPTPPLPMSL